MKRHSDGFSLVEVIIAIAVLAVVAMSLLAYFSSANRYTNWGKTTQKADMAAQSVIEELASCTTFDQIKNDLASGSAVWVVESPEPSDNSYRLTRSISVDGTDYKARVKLDFEPYKGTSSTDPTPTPLSKFNDYQAPQLDKVYSENNVVLEETDQTETALSDLFYQAYQNDKGITKEDIRGDGEEEPKGELKRTMHIDIKPYETDKLYLVKGWYEYSYEKDGATYSCETPVKDVKIEKDALDKIYLFYRPVNSKLDKETLDITAGSGISPEKFSYYVIRQEEKAEPSDAATPAPTSPPYILEITSEGNSASPDLKDKVYNNAKLASGSDSLIRHEAKDRIAMITVEIYYADEKDFNEENRIVMVQTSKGA